VVAEDIVEAVLASAYIERRVVERVFVISALSRRSRRAGPGTSVDGRTGRGGFVPGEPGGVPFLDDAAEGA